MNDTISRLVGQLASRLLENGYRITTAESCTGGLIAKTLTDLPGSSGWFERGFITYSNTAKIEMLAVPAAEIETDGAVSQPVVRAMLYRFWLFWTFRLCTCQRFLIAGPLHLRGG